MTYPIPRETLRPYRLPDADYRDGERLSCGACGGHTGVGVRVAILDCGEEIYLCPHCVQQAADNLAAAGERETGA